MKALITIVIPSHGRSSLIGALIKSIRRVEQIDNTLVEIILVDSTPMPEREMIIELCDQYNVKYLECVNSVSEKRNLGAQVADTEYVMFVDSDCELEPGCLTSHLMLLDNQKVDASCGVLYFTGHKSFIFRSIEKSGILAAFESHDNTEILSWAPTANIVLRRSSFLHIQFDPLFGPPRYGGEDVDFGLRFTDQGYKMIRNSNAKVRHSTLTWNRFVDNYSRFKAWGAADAHLVNRYKDKSVVDMPSPVLMILMFALLTLGIAISHPFALLTGMGGFIVYLFIASGFPRGKGILSSVFAQFVYLVLDYARINEAIKQGLWGSTIRRLKFSSTQISDEWEPLMYSSIASHFLIIYALIMCWLY
jgi:glycosyltransferase involved in cell wall biosynthesis